MESSRPAGHHCASPYGLGSVMAGRSVTIRCKTTDGGWGQFKRPLWGHCKRPLRALDSAAAAGRTYTLAGPAMTMRSFAQACIGAFGSDSRFAHVPISVLAVASMLARVAPLPFYSDQLARMLASKPGALARRDLGFRPRGVEEGLAVTRVRLLEDFGTAPASGQARPTA